MFSFLVTAESLLLNRDCLDICRSFTILVFSMPSVDTVLGGGEQVEPGPKLINACIPLV